MDSQHKEQTARLEADIKHLADRFDRHLEIYAQNGKELAALKSEVRSNHRLLLQTLHSLADKVENNTEKQVSADDFKTVRMIVYGGVSLILVAVASAFIGLVILE